jgi:hypothetical protein
MLKCANATLEILLEFGMCHPYQSLAIDKCSLLIRCYLFFNEFKLLNTNYFLLFLFGCILYSILFVVHNLLYIVNYTLCIVNYILYTIYYI